MIPSMYAKLFSRIAQSSLMEEDVEVRYCFMMLLAIADSTGDVIGTDIALARTVNLPLDTFRRCVAELMEPDKDSNSQVFEGRRIVLSENGRGYQVVNYVTYRQIKTNDEKRAYMREYMQRRRKVLKVNDVTPCKTLLTDVTHAEAEGEAEGDTETYQTKAPAKAGGIVDGKGSDRIPTSEQAKRVAKIMHRRIDTAWDKKEVDAYVAIGVIPEDDMAILEKYYASNWPPKTSVNHLRQNLVTLLNNFQGEIDRAKHFFTAAKFISKPKPKAST